MRNKNLVWNKGSNWIAPSTVSSVPLKSDTTATNSSTNNEEKVTLINRTIGKLIWSDEFNDQILNSRIWTARFCGQAAINGGGTCYNNESQYYLPDAVSVDGSGNAVISTKYISTKPSQGTCLGDKCSFTSGRFDTQGKVSFLYGYIEARIKMPVGSGNWPAFWMLGTNITSIGWPNSGEVDIAEGFGNAKTRTSSAIHYSTSGEGCCNNHLFDYIRYDVGQDYSSSFHTFGVAWLPNEISFYVDRKLIFQTSSTTIRSKIWPFNTANFLILNNAVTFGEGFGGAWGGWIYSNMLIDYVRQYELDGKGELFYK